MHKSQTRPLTVNFHHSIVVLVPSSLNNAPRGGTRPGLITCDGWVEAHTRTRQGRRCLHLDVLGLTALSHHMRGLSIWMFTTGIPHPFVWKMDWSAFAIFLYIIPDYFLSCPLRGLKNLVSPPQYGAPSFRSKEEIPYQDAAVKMKAANVLLRCPIAISLRKRFWLAQSLAASVL